MDPDGDSIGAQSPAINQRSSHDEDFVGRIQREMLQLSLERTSLNKNRYPVGGTSFSSSLSYLCDLNPSSVPYLHTSYRGEERARNSQLRLLRDADLKAILDPMDLPKYEDHVTVPIPPRPTTANGGRHSEVRSDADEKKNSTKPKSEKENHVPTDKLSGKGSNRPVGKPKLKDATNPLTQSHKPDIKQKLKKQRKCAVKVRVPVADSSLHCSLIGEESNALPLEPTKVSLFQFGDLVSSLS